MEDNKPKDETTEITEKTEAADNTEELEQAAPENAPKKRKKALAVLAVSLAAALVLVMALFTVIIPAVNYKRAVSLKNGGRYDEAIATFGKTRGFKDSDEQINACYAAIYGEAKWTEYKDIAIGQSYTFGAYPQTKKGDGKTPIEWRVLAKEGNRLLLISEYALDCRQYDEGYQEETWETCSLRRWLNEDFLNAAFSPEEQALIQTVQVSADKNPKSSANQGKATEDKVFLLSVTEANRYFASDADRQCVPTEYAKARGAFADGENSKDGKAHCWWWLRSNGDSRAFSVFVNTDGSLDYYGCYLEFDMDCVRPALWINLAP